MLDRHALILVAISLLASACGEIKLKEPAVQKQQDGSQQVSQEKPKPVATTIVHRWKLTQSSDPAVTETLSELTYLEFEFKADFTFAVYNVVDGLRYTAPVLHGNYVVSGNDLSLAFTDPVGEIEYHFEITSDGLELVYEIDGDSYTYSFQLLD